MRGRQVNFFLSLQDQELLDRILSKNADLVALEYNSISNSPQFRDNTLVKQMGKEVLRINLARKSDVGDLIFKKDEKSGLYSVDVLTSPVIAYSRCYVNNELIRLGRLYLNSSYHDEHGQKIKKSSDFLTWADRIFNKVRSILHHRGDGIYCGEGALKAERNGILLRAL